MKGYTARGRSCVKRSVGMWADGRTDKQLKKFARYFMIALLKQISREQALHYDQLFLYYTC